MRMFERWRTSTDAARFEAYTWWSLVLIMGIVPFIYLGGSGGATTDPEPDASPPVLDLPDGATVVVLVGVAVLHAAAAVRVLRDSLALRLGRGEARRGSLTLLTASTVVAVLAAVLLMPMSVQWPATGGFLATVALAATLAAFGTRWTARRLALAGLPATAVVLLTSVRVPGLGPQHYLLLALASCAIILGFAFSVWLSAWMVEVVRRLEDARSVKSRLAVAEERLRFSRDLHDTLGRSLSAIAVKSELAAELARRGRAESAEEMASVRDLAHGALAEVRSVAEAYRRVDLADELDGARSLLRSTGAVTSMSADTEGISDPAQDVLAWVVREGVTNVVRHSSARHVELVLEQHGDDTVLTLVNDAAAGPEGDDVQTSSADADADADADDGDRPGAGRGSGGAGRVRRGTGLAGLEERVARIGGTLQTRLDGDRFTLRARVPSRLRAQPGDADAGASGPPPGPPPGPPVGATTGETTR
ncbi:MAG: sensor histidine kinase [Actinomycetaceae bacterium]